MYIDAHSKSNNNSEYGLLGFSKSEIKILLILSHYPNNALVQLHETSYFKTLIRLFSSGTIILTNVKEILPDLMATDLGEYYFPTLVKSKSGEYYLTDNNDDNFHIYEHLSKDLKIKLTPIGRYIISQGNTYGWQL